jgi:hypothetical protein
MGGIEVRFKVGDIVYWPQAPQREEYAVCAIVFDKPGRIIAAGINYAVEFEHGDIRSPFVADELVSEEEWNSPLMKALR